MNIKNKKGFTLVELLAVIIVLSLVALIAVPNITKSLKKSRDDLYNVQLKSFIDAAKTWEAENIELSPKEGDAPLNLSLKTLVEDGFLDAPIRNPKTKKDFILDDVYIEIKVIGKRTTYTVKGV